MWRQSQSPLQLPMKASEASLALLALPAAAAAAAASSLRLEGAGKSSGPPNCRDMRQAAWAKQHAEALAAAAAAAAVPGRAQPASTAALC
jgi:hypothetical protein